MDETARREIEALLISGKKLAAVKRYREATGASLAESKQAVERIGEQHGIPVTSGSGCLGVILVVIVGIACLHFGRAIV